MDVQAANLKQAYRHKRYAIAMKLNYEFINDIMYIKTLLSLDSDW